MLVKKGKYLVIADVSDRKDATSGDKHEKGGQASIQLDPTEMKDIPLVGQETPGSGITLDLGGDRMKTKASDYQKKGGSKIYKGPESKVKSDWKKLGAEALSRTTGMSEKMKRLLKELTESKPIVDWKNKLKNFFDRSLNSFREVMPKRRFASSGTFLRGLKRGGEATFKTVVAVVDTSGSISQKQSNTFITEVMHLCKMFQADITYIIYCSDDIGIKGKGGIDIVKRGQKPDFSKWVTTGGNRKGFIPPFEWLERNKIVPSVLVYLTDTGGEMPNPEKYGIPKYKNRVFWFICGPKMYNEPPFGEIIWAPTTVLD